MYDNLPFYTSHKPTIEAFLNSDMLDYVTEQTTPFPREHERAGETKKTTTIHKYYNLTIVVTYNADNELVELYSKGSFHYLMNKGRHNANFFKISDAQNFLIDFAHIFDIDLKYLILKPFECAKMIVLPNWLDIEDVIRSTICESKKMFVRNGNFPTSKISGKTTDNYRLKFYSKSHEHEAYCLPNTLRTEVQFKKMRDPINNGINTMADLLRYESWVYLREYHLKSFQQIVVYDNSIRIPKNSKYKSDLIELSNQNEWEKLIQDCKKGEVYRTKYNEKVKTLRMLSKKYGSNIYDIIIKSIDNQWFKFMERCLHSHYKVGHFPTHAPLSNSTHAPFIACNISTYFQKSFIKICPITNLDISMQKRGSNLLSNTGLKYYEKKEPETFKRIAAALLTGRYNEFEKSIYSKISKQIRNRYYNNLSIFFNDQLNLF